MNRPACCQHSKLSPNLGLPLCPAQYCLRLEAFREEENKITLLSVCPAHTPKSHEQLTRMMAWEEGLKGEGQLYTAGTYMAVNGILCV